MFPVGNQIFLLKETMFFNIFGFQSYILYILEIYFKFAFIFPIFVFGFKGFWFFFYMRQQQ